MNPSYPLHALATTRAHIAVTGRLGEDRRANHIGNPPRFEGRRNLGIGRHHAATAVLILVATQTVTVTSKTGHRIIASHTIDPDRNYWRNQQKNPADGRGDL